MAPRVHLNCAMSLDGCIGSPGPKPLKLSSPEDFKRVHELRAQSDAILVGIGTVLADDPKLTVKWELVGKRGKNPLRVVLDARLRTPPTAQVLQGDAPTLLLHGKKGGAMPGNVQLGTIPADRFGNLHLPTVLAELERLKVRTLMVEGGSSVISSFLEQNLVDEFTVYVAPRLVGDPSAPRLYLGHPRDLVGLKLANTHKLGEGSLLRFVRA